MQSTQHEHFTHSTYDIDTGIMILASGTKIDFVNGTIQMIDQNLGTLRDPDDLQDTIDHLCNLGDMLGVMLSTVYRLTQHDCTLGRFVGKFQKGYQS